MANRVAPDGGDASIRSKHCNEPRYGRALVIRNRRQPPVKSQMAEAQPSLGSDVSE
jgi:hypothetical protein